MVPHKIPGHEPDSTDMAQEPGTAGQALNPDPIDPGLAEEEQGSKLGDFA